MLTSIRKITTSFLAKVLVVIIILPFLFWGMGDVFSGGNQNIVATIDSKKISAQNFGEYVNKLNLSNEQIKSLNKSDLLDKILSAYIGREIITLEIKEKGIFLSDLSLREIITGDKIFLENDEFSRTKYEKFLLESGISAPIFEQNIAEQEKKRQLLSYLSEGILLPESMVKKEFENENQIKTIQYLELDELYKKVQIKNEEIKKTYESNKRLFSQEFKKINYTELLPANLTGQQEYNEAYFGKIDEIENAVLDGGSLEEFVKKYNLSLSTIDETNRLRKDKAGKDILIISDTLFSKLFSLVDIKKTELINMNNKYYLGNIEKIEKISKTLKDKEVKKAITSQLKIKYIIENNANIVKEMSNGKFKKKQFDKLGKENSIEIKKITLRDIKDESIFKSDVVKEIFKVKDGELQLITDSMFTKNYIIFSEKTEKLPFNKNKKVYEQYKIKAKARIANQIYNTYDESINKKYDIDINQKVLSRIKNTI